MRRYEIMWVIHRKEQDARSPDLSRNLETHPRLALKVRSAVMARAYSWMRSISISSPTLNCCRIHLLMSSSILGEDRLLPPPLLRKMPWVDQRLMFLQGMRSLRLISVMGSSLSTSSRTALSFSAIEQLLQGPRLQHLPSTDTIDPYSSSTPSSDCQNASKDSPSSGSPSSTFTCTESSLQRGLATSMFGRARGAVGRTVSCCTERVGWGMVARRVASFHCAANWRERVRMRLRMPRGWFQMQMRALSCWLGRQMAMQSRTLRRKTLKDFCRYSRARWYSESAFSIVTVLYYSGLGHLKRRQIGQSKKGQLKLVINTCLLRSKLQNNT